MTVRFFAGWDYSARDLSRSDWQSKAYAKGVPMGGTLTGARRGRALRILASVLKDPDGANLDRVQIIEGWRGEDGSLHEKIYDVAYAGTRKPDPKTGKIPAIGSTVDVRTATYTNSIGSAALSVAWTDPDFDPRQRAFYCVRALEIPTPRWTLYDAVRFKVTPPKDVPLTTQERIYSSPIWYDPD